MLSSMKVLSFSHFVQGPSASQYLADLGADVIKIEPLQGAWERKIGSGRIRVAGRSVTFLAVNRNKRSLAIDLKHPRAKEVLTPLVATSDVVMENYRLGALDRLGFGFDVLRAIKPDLIYASATGWGSSGPMAEKPGVDILVQARSGLISVTGSIKDNPAVPGTPIIDHHGATLLALGVLAAYAKKLVTGEGTRVESSLLSAALDLQAESLALYYSGKKQQADIHRDGHLAAWFIDAPYGVYELADAHVVIALSGSMEHFATAIGSDELIALGVEGRFTDRDTFTRCLSRALASWTFARLEEVLGPYGFWFERVADYDDLRNDPQVISEQRFASIDVEGQPVTVVNHPIRYDGKVPDIRLKPPELSEHSSAILREVGFSDEEVASFLKDGVIS
jgi:crotonobetainyl-CoA:carnitine CoA-transferase CaiB-like acyl-CoA transferase